MSKQRFLGGLLGANPVRAGSFTDVVPGTEPNYSSPLTPSTQSVSGLNTLMYGPKWNSDGTRLEYYDDFWNAYQYFDASTPYDITTLTQHTELTGQTTTDSGAGAVWWTNASRTKFFMVRPNLASPSMISRHNFSTSTGVGTEISGNPYLNTTNQPTSTYKFGTGNVVDSNTKLVMAQMQSGQIHVHPISDGMTHAHGTDLGAPSVFSVANIEAAAMHPDGSFCAALLNDGTLKMFEMSTAFDITTCTEVYASSSGAYGNGMDVTTGSTWTPPALFWGDNRLFIYDNDTQTMYDVDFGKLGTSTNRTTSNVGIVSLDEAGPEANGSNELTPFNWGGIRGRDTVVGPAGYSAMSSEGILSLSQSLQALYGLSPYHIKRMEPELALDFIGGEYRTAGATATFADAFTGTSPKLTYSTTSNSTMVNSAGNIVWAPHNLHSHSSDVASWASKADVTASSSSGNELGDIPTTLFTATGGSAQHRAFDVQLTNTGHPVTFSFYIKPGTFDYVQFHDGVTVTYWADFDLTGNGSVIRHTGFDATPTIEAVTSAGQTFFKVTVQYTAASAASGVLPIISFPDPSTVVSTATRNPTWTAAGTETLYVGGMHLYRSDLGGMAQVPGAATGFETYVPTNSSAEYLPRVGHHVYNGSTWVNEGLLIESEARTNLLLNSSTLSTQSVTVTAAAHTLSFTGTGTITLSGVSTDGPLVGTGTGEGNRVSLTFTPTAGSLTLTVSGTVSNAQLELGSTPSSYMPTDGGTYTRAAQSLEVPPAEFGWPEPEYIGSELVTNGDFGTGDLSGWTDASFGTGTAVYNSGGADLTRVDVSNEGQIRQAITTTAGRIYEVSYDRTSGTSGRVWVGTGTSGTDRLNIGEFPTTGASNSFTFVATGSTTYLLFNVGANGVTVRFDNISVREINPLSVSIQMDGRMTYADNNSTTELEPWRWYEDINNYIQMAIRTDGTFSGGPNFGQKKDTSTFISNASLDPYSPGINVPFNIAGRHGSTFINGAADGVALTASTAPTALPDLSNTNLQIAYDFMGTIGTFRQFAGDIGDTGLVTAANPSTEPTLSLTFDGTNGSFYNLSWSE